MGRSRGFDIDDALDAAVRTFWEHGYEASSMQTLCDAMRVQPGSAYAAFGPKRALFVAALRRYAETVSADAVRRITTPVSGLQGLRDYFDHLIEAMVDGNRRWGCLITNSLVEFAERDPELAGLVGLHLANLRAAFEAALARAAAAGELRPGAGPEAAALLVAVAQGMNVLAKSRPGRAPLRAIVDATLAGLVA
ncbi:TetR family transcriptional regulator [Pseudonocardia sulfidoxydans NBRC 16205]|uniref:TetR family transcriptional regulator n=1 Tax=Pseudonocardia sulfidoxydans NBRC 16205 TaxID=1223511 RepID=A0A511DJV8_9PSEU|nr:TetR/AcrR family transcriptional regulator [Pseudonocardia sulfidoxydans]GEL25101.1 TetR family transcriptional regulator [Pseudonocardia sulfidoxydans NBRC 16205]